MIYKKGKPTPDAKQISFSPLLTLLKQTKESINVSGSAKMTTPAFPGLQLSSWKYFLLQKKVLILLWYLKVLCWIDPFFRLNEEHFTFHLQYKHSGTFANRKYGELSYPKKSENVLPHFIQSSLENGTPSSGTSPLASYKEVLPPPHPLGLKTVTQQMQKEPCHVRTSLKGWNRLQLIFSLENGESNPKNNSQLYNSNFIRSEIKLYKYILFNKGNQIIDSWN